MAASNFSTLSAKHRILRPSFFDNGDFYDIRDTLTCSSVSRFHIRDNLSLPSWKHKNLAITSYGPSPSFPLLRRQVKNDDSEGISTDEFIILDEQDLEQELQTAIESENYAQAAKIRDRLKLLKEDSKAAVLAANARFYNSFRKGDMAAMQALWSEGEHVCVVHPGVSGISGHDRVNASWEFVWAAYEFPLNIDVKDVRIHVIDNVGYVTCIEMVKTQGNNWGRQFATNVFEKINGQWFICIHHASCLTREFEF